LNNKKCQLSVEVKHKKADLTTNISEQPDFSTQPAAGVPASGRKLQLPTEDLRKAWAVSRRISKDDWLEWYNGLCREFLKVSPSPALRACWTVAQRYTQLAKDLFNASFVSCWSELDALQQVCTILCQPVLTFFR
jgi:hypothetical protein